MTTTTEKVLAMRKRDPQRRATDMAVELGVSRTRIRQILREQGLPTQINTHFTQPCGWCGEPVTRPRSQFKYNKSGLIFCNQNHWGKWGWRLGLDKYHERVRQGLALLEAQEAVDTEPGNC